MEGVDFSKLILAPDFYGEDPEDQELLLAMVAAGRSGSPTIDGASPFFEQLRSSSRTRAQERIT